ncbi:hypothetical protein GCM10025881_31800 [Pseudolysinimonas kribbensis]|uniref:Uncharacterized protein n=1 Tax=Pseudolysinimonas kribbensis TaxID=433641 RepID=A0ABQ6K6S8_9MICO|nr:hypothetical protein GCM10025881_31800 [Pseudolysinimonas kribbensis]
MAAAAATLIPAMSATAAPTCDTGCVVSFTPGAQTTWTVPSDATDVTVVVAGGAGGASVYASTPAAPEAR